MAALKFSFALVLTVIAFIGITGGKHFRREEEEVSLEERCDLMEGLANVLSSRLSVNTPSRDILCRIAASENLQEVAAVFGQPVEAIREAYSFYSGVYWHLIEEAIEQNVESPDPVLAEEIAIAQALDRLGYFDLE